jgi:hypothetical protein
LTTILDSGFFSGAAQPIAQNTPLIAPVAETPAKTPKKPRKPKKNQTLDEAPVTAQAGSRKRSQRNGANTTALGASRSFGIYKQFTPLIFLGIGV